MKIFLTLIIFLASYSSGFSQLPSDVIRQQEQSQRQRNEEDRHMQQEAGRINRQARESFKDMGTPKYKQKKWGETSETSHEYEEALSLNKEDLYIYKDFLKAKNTGILKLFPDLKCENDSKYVVKVDGDCANVPQDLWGYSFLRKNYNTGLQSDIRFEKERLIADGFLTQNLLTSLGDIPLESINLSNENLKFLINFKAPLNPKEADTKYAEITKGIFANGLRYGKDAKVDLNTSYVLKLIPYKIKKLSIKSGERLRKFSEREESLMTIKFREPIRREKIIVFRIIRIDPNKGISILWKELSDKKAPVLDMEVEI